MRETLTGDDYAVSRMPVVVAVAGAAATAVAVTCRLDAGNESVHSDWPLEAD